MKKKKLNAHSLLFRRDAASKLAKTIVTIRQSKDYRSGEKGGATDRWGDKARGMSARGRWWEIDPWFRYYTPLMKVIWEGGEGGAETLTYGAQPGLVGKQPIGGNKKNRKFKVRKRAGETIPVESGL